jgi:hypothetical protein
MMLDEMNAGCHPSDSLATPDVGPQGPSGVAVHLGVREPVLTPASAPQAKAVARATAHAVLRAARDVLASPQHTPGEVLLDDLRKRIEIAIGGGQLGMMGMLGARSSRPSRGRRA